MIAASVITKLKKNLVFSFSGFFFTDLLACCYDNYKYFTLNIQVVSIFLVFLGAISHYCGAHFKIEDFSNVLTTGFLSNLIVGTSSWFHLI